MLRAKMCTWNLWAGWCVALLISAASARADDKTLIEWRFDRAGELCGWQSVGQSPT